MSTSPADHLRVRARTLRVLAGQLQRLEVLSLASLAGSDTWLGPTPQRCADSLRSTRTSLLDHVDELVRTARRFEQQADQLAAVIPVGASQ